MLLRLCLIAVSGAVLGTLPRAEGYTWPAIRYSPPNACGKNETFDQNSFVCIRCGRAERPRDTAEGGFCIPYSFVTEVMVNPNGTAPIHRLWLRMPGRSQGGPGYRFLRAAGEWAEVYEVALLLPKRNSGPLKLTSQSAGATLPSL